MALFFLEYDLRKQVDYQRLYDELKNFNAIRILDSLWCFNRTNINCKALRDHFQQFIDTDDGLVVSEVADWATWTTLSNPISCRNSQTERKNALKRERAAFSNFGASG